jgi:fructose-1,6-bisphosphatase-3
MDTDALSKKTDKYLRQLAGQYPNIQSVCTEIINLRAILNLPKGTEHFLSDLHGEYEAFTHILNNCSGVVREKMDELFGEGMEEHHKAELCTLVYYPREKLRDIRQNAEAPDAWCEDALQRLIELTRHVAVKYTRSKVRKALPPEFGYIIDELLHADYSGQDQTDYHEKIMEGIVALRRVDEFIVALASLIKRLAVDSLHIVGDIFDRGPRPDLILDMLMEHHNVDIQWGNHDVLWMGAAAGSAACVAAAVVNCAAFGNMWLLEQGYGVNLRPLAMFADKTYAHDAAFAPRLQKGDPASEQERSLATKIHKAAAIILFKLEGALVQKHPEYGMEDRLLLDKINLETGAVNIGGRTYPLRNCDFPTLDPADPYALTLEEADVLRGLVFSFGHSERLQRQIRFLYSHGEMYSIVNQNLIFHGCVPVNEDGTFAKATLCGKTVSGKALMDWCDMIARSAYFNHKEAAQDAMWYLWCGRLSPLYGRDKMTTFERRFIADEAAWTEIKNAYYRYIEDEAFCLHVIRTFGLDGEISHIINGHVPVKKGESAVKAGGKLIVIDGGFCKAYQPQTGIAGYTLIYNSRGMRLSAHMPFESIEKAIAENADINSEKNKFEVFPFRLRVMDSDAGQEISERIFDLSRLLEAYKQGDFI